MEPTGFQEQADGKLEVAVYQVVKNLEGNLLFDGPVKHIYTIQDKLFKQMDIEPVSQVASL